MGAWACEACVASLALDVAGQASSNARSHWCGAGGHRVAGAVRWAPDGSNGKVRAIAVPALEVGQQGRLLNVQNCVHRRWPRV